VFGRHVGQDATTFVAHNVPSEAALHFQVQAELITIWYAAKKM
jgi:hypothetical protein